MFFFHLNFFLLLFVSLFIKTRKFVFTKLPLNKIVKGFYNPPINFLYICFFYALVLAHLDKYVSFLHVNDVYENKFVYFSF